jgi:hypothetical protein
MIINSFRIEGANAMKRSSLVQVGAVFGMLVSWAGAGESVSGITVSGDSRTVAYLVNTQRPIGGRFGREAAVERRISVAWCDAGSPQIARKLEVDVFEELSGEAAVDFAPGRIEFSPNGRKLAVLTPHRLTVIDLKFYKRLFWVETEERVSSFHWLSDTEVGYVKHGLKEYDHVAAVFPPPPHTSYSRTFWVVQTMAGGRHIICTDEEVFRLGRRGGRGPMLPMQPEVWSPDGRYVAYVSGRQVKVLRIRDRNLKSLGRAGFDTRVFWKPDSSALFFADSEYRTAGLFKTATSTLTDFSSRLEYELGAVLEGLVLDGWMSDGKFLVFNGDGGCGSYIVRLEPFKAVGVGHYADRGESRAYVTPAPMENTVCVYGGGLSLARVDSNGRLGNVRHLLSSVDEAAVFAPNGQFMVTRTSEPARIRIHNTYRVAALN